ncbi:MAG: hypothetical protein IPJ03_17595 [Ignavibacteriales bacterium]|nr:hypothetical protein [Ignavibacteriales bacterium]
MPDKKINIVFNAVGDAAAQKMKEVTAGIDQVQKTALRTTPTIKENNFALMNMSRIVQDLPFGFMGIGNNITFMAEQMARAKAEGQSFSTQLKGMLSSLMGTGGLMFAISAVTSLITYFSMQSRGAAESTKSLAEELKDMWGEAFKTSVQFEKLAKDLEKFTVAELNESLRSVNKTIKETGLAWYEAGLYGMGFKSVLSDQILELHKLKKEQEALEKALNPKSERPKGILELLKDERDKYETLKNQATTLSDIVKYKNIIFAIDGRIAELDGGRTKELKNQTKELKDQKVIWEDFARMRNREMDRVGMPLPTTMNPQGGRAGNTRGASMQGGMAMMAGMRTEDIKNQFAEFNVIAQSAADTMRQAFSQAWQDIFGEANSLLEMFLQNIASGLLSLAAESVATSIFSFLTGGVSGLLLKPSTGGDNIINLKIGDDTVEKFVFKGLPGAMNRGIRTRAF